MQELVCVCMCGGGLHVIDCWMLSVSVSACLCVCVCVGPSMRGAGVDGLLYHSLGCGLDSSLQDVGDCVMSV